MATNVGTLDRALRVLLGVILIAAPFVSGMALFMTGWVTAVSVILGLVLLATAATRFCALYTLFGIKTGEAS